MPERARLTVDPRARLARPRPVRIRYHRPPDSTQVYVQELVLDAPDLKVSVATDLSVAAPKVIAGHVAMEPGSRIVWFTFPGRWHDIGRCHRADGSFTGYYANILTPAVFHAGDVWETTDLFLDVWTAETEAGPSRSDIGPVLSSANACHEPTVLDEAEFEQAVRAGWVDTRQAGAARREVDRILTDAAAGVWPPAIVREWCDEPYRDPQEGSADSSTR